MNENDLVDLVQLMCFQTKEQYRAVLVLGSPNSGKTKFAKLLAEKSKAKYIDLLDVFLNNKNMSDNIDTFGVSSLKKYLLNLPADEAIIIVDNVDFLLNTWSDREKGEFLNIVEKLRSNETKKTFCFFAQISRTLSSKQIYNSQNNSRILTMNHIAHIKEDTQ
jgi:adenosyl cobinamide kinase/adenosyl cobinamide phosphate guanylyltransferase